MDITGFIDIAMHIFRGTNKEINNIYACQCEADTQVYAGLSNHGWIDDLNSEFLGNA